MHLRGRGLLGALRCHHCSGARRRENPAWKDGRAIFAAAKAGDKTVLALLDAWTDEIAQGLAGMVHIFNPQLILIGGGVSAQQKLLIEPRR